MNKVGRLVCCAVVVLLFGLAGGGCELKERVDDLGETVDGVKEKVKELEEGLEKANEAAEQAKRELADEKEALDRIFNED